MRRTAAWGLIGLSAAMFVLAGDVRTNWVVGDVAPELGNVALPRLATIALLIGLTLLVAHQVRVRRALPDDRYRGPSVLAMLGILTILWVLLVLPVRGTINLALEGAVPDLAPVVIWLVAPHLATLIVCWLVLRTNPLPRDQLLRDSRPLRHALIGIGVGIPTHIAVLTLLAGAELASGGAALQVAPASPASLFPPGVPLWLGAASSVVLAPVAEELLFRGIALRAWLRERGFWPAVIGSSVVFGLLHFGLNPLDGLLPDLPRLLILSAGGFILALLAIRTGTLVAPIAAHATMNAFGVLLSLLFASM